MANLGRGKGGERELCCLARAERENDSIYLAEEFAFSLGHHTVQNGGCGNCDGGCITSVVEV